MIQSSLVHYTYIYTNYSTFLDMYLPYSLRPTKPFAPYAQLLRIIKCKCLAQGAKDSAKQFMKSTPDTVLG